MTYAEALEFLYQRLPMFQRVGGVAFKKDLLNIKELCAYLGQPQERFASIHVAGTNGKGSSAHMIAAVMQAAGYKTGLYTSPHLKDFSERIRVNGKPIKQDSVTGFVEQHRQVLAKIKPSFFEMTVALAFQHFAHEKVDLAIIEVGLGGRLDSTNIITPLVSLITNISLDHQSFLGDSLSEIAAEKAGIIKSQIPVIIGQRNTDLDPVFEKRADLVNAPLCFAQDVYQVAQVKPCDGGLQMEVTKENNTFLLELVLDLAGDYQRANLPGVLMTVQMLAQQGFPVDEQALRKGLSQVRTLTGLRGRWQTLGERPLMICDTGHNVGAWSWLLAQFEQIKYDRLIMVIGLVNDKDPQPILELMPKNAYYYFCQAQIPRALEAELLRDMAEAVGLEGMVVPEVNQAVQKAREHSQPEDLIFIGGSTFVVAEIDQL